MIYLGYITTKKHEEATGHHLNLLCHSLAKLTATIKEKVKINDPGHRKGREKYHIRKFKTFTSALCKNGLIFFFFTLIAWSGEPLREKKK